MAANANGVSGSGQVDLATAQQTYARRVDLSMSVADLEKASAAFQAASVASGVKVKALKKSLEYVNTQTQKLPGEIASLKGQTERLKAAACDAADKAKTAFDEYTKAQRRDGQPLSYWDIKDPKVAKDIRAKAAVAEAKWQQANVVAYDAGVAQQDNHDAIARAEAELEAAPGVKASLSTEMAAEAAKQTLYAGQAAELSTRANSWQARVAARVQAFLN